MIDLGSPYEMEYCEEWDDEKEICLKNYPKTCPNRENCKRKWRD